MTPARRHYQAITAGVEAVRVIGQADASTPLQDRMQALQHAHRATLKGFKSLKSKIATKAKFLPAYDAYVAGVLAADAGGADAVLVTVMVWRIDVGDYAGALAIAEYAIRHRLELPSTFKRDLQTTVVEEIAVATLSALKASTPLPAGTAEALDRALDLTEGADMPDEVRSKAYKALGLLRRDTAPAEALTALRLALSLDSNCTVKTEIGRLERQLNAASPDDAALPPPDADAAATP